MATLTDAGIAAILADGYTQFAYLALGTGTPDENGCGTELGRIAISVKEVNAQQMVLEAQADAAEVVGVLTELAFMTAAIGGTCLGYDTLNSVEKENGVPMIFSRTIDGSDLSV